MPETVACLLCGSSRAESEPRHARFLRFPAGLGIARCPDCGLRFQSPRLDLVELGALYARHPYYQASNAHRGAARRDFYRGRLARLERWRPNRGRLLGIACLEGGYMFEVAEQGGWSVEAVEFAPILADHARQLGVNVQVAEGWDLASFQGKRFDAVLSLSLEHVPDPRKTLRQCRGLLVEDGVLLIDVPNQLHSLKDKIKAASRAVLGPSFDRHFFSEVASEFHMTFFDPRTIRRTLAEEGFEVLELRTYLPRHPVYLANPRGRWLQDAIYRLGGRFERGPSIEVIARPTRTAH
ncbi:MAG: class I SAM-dependent methyltransferase [bacterium]